MDKIEVRGQTFTMQALTDAGRLLGLLGDEIQQAALKSLRAGDFENAKDQQRIADRLRAMDIARWVEATESGLPAEFDPRLPGFVPDQP